MNLLQNIDVKNKTVILRCDLNVTIKDGIIQSDERIKASLETINYLINENAKVIIMSHLGRVKTEEDKENNSLKPVYEVLKDMLNAKTYFSNTTRGVKLEEMINNLNYGEVLLMENTRFEDINNKKESNCDEELVNCWSTLGDIFIHDAFGMTHRRHASTYGLFKKMNSAIGFLVQKEIAGLAPVINPEHPFVVLMSGAKVKDKIKLMADILEKCDYLLVGGGIANTFLSLNKTIGTSLVDNESIEAVKELLNKYSNKIILPIDAVVTSTEIKSINNIEADEAIFDIGPETIKKYTEYINQAKTIFINGTVGMYEDDRYAAGTKEILNICSKASAKTILGGGDALASAEKFNIKDFDFISTGGGASLDYIGTGKLNGLED